MQFDIVALGFFNHTVLDSYRRNIPTYAHILVSKL